MQKNKALSIFLKYYLDKNLDSQLSIDKNFLLKVWALSLISQLVGRSVTRSLGYSVAPSLGQLVGWSVNWTVSITCLAAPACD